MKRLIPALLLAALASGCGLVFDPQGGPVEHPPVSGEELGPTFAAPNGGPPIECRGGLTRDHCLGPGTIEDGVAGVSLRDVQRVIVTCDSEFCDDAGGAFRIDVLLRSGVTQEIGAGGYGETEQP